MNIFDVLDYGFILAWDKDTGIIVTWNGSATYNVFAEDEEYAKWRNIDVRTINPNPTGHPVAMGAARTFAEEILDDVLRGE